jgi:hypothetical protein
LNGAVFRRPYGVLVAAAFFLWAGPTPATAATLAVGAGVFQYYARDGERLSSHAGPAAALAFAHERDVFGWGGEARYRRYGRDEYEAGGEVRPRYYFHPAPARPYLAPAAAFWLARDGGRTYRTLSVGARAGGVLTAEGFPLKLDVFAAYRGRFNVDADERRPAFTSELLAGATCDWFVTGRFGLHAEASLLWPGSFAERHETLHGPGVTPFVLVGPAFSF